MEELKRHYVMKGVGAPRYYLGGDVIDLNDQWKKEGAHQAFSSETYLQNCIPKLENMLGVEFGKKSVPFNPDYHPELDESPLVDSEKITLYRSLIGSGNWILTLGRFDIAYALSSMSRYNMAPREGHFDALIQMFGYLKKHMKGQIVIDYKSAPIRGKALISSRHNWSEFYSAACEEIPYNMAKPKGVRAELTAYVNADRARDKLTRRSVTGIILMINNTPLSWMSKRQKTVETSTYKSELIAAQIAVDMIIEWRYKLRMLGITLEAQSWMLGDNMAVVINTTLPSSSLKKKHLACT
jgi:hypothetical protein